MMCERKHSRTLECYHDFVTYPGNKSCEALLKNKIMAKEIEKIELNKPFSEESPSIVYANIKTLKTATRISNIHTDATMKSFFKSKNSKMMFDPDIYISGSQSIYTDGFADIYNESGFHQSTENIYDLNTDVNSTGAGIGSGSNNYGSFLDEDDNYSVYQPAGEYVENNMDKLLGNTNKYIE
ncbi:hypothetical protein RF11_07002 [Thelohanellus kitauei]|uniref:Uncharacterized protein n=1 Tax=Thelohanellus kitauei TaxID=669202 RepID=A0A0C2MM92_THEKT|nr:hypothetical protein RF11_07002 [Thelohanellus kitauei]